MADTASVIYSHADGSVVNCFTEDAEITWQFPGKSVERQPNKIGIDVDPNMVFRVVTCSFEQTGDQVNTLNGYLMPASAPTYDGSYPKVVVALDGDTNLTILCMVTDVKASDKGAGKWHVRIQFTERSA